MSTSEKTTKSTKATSDATEAPSTPEVAETDALEEILDNEIERLLPEVGEPLALLDGTQVFVRPLKLKELFAAFKIITRGAAMSMGALSFSIMQENQDQFAETMIALLINAFPEADVEFCEFLRIMVDPVPPADGWENREERIAAEAHLDELLLNDSPEIDDAIDIVATVIYRESKDIQRLGKKIANAAKMFSKVAPPAEKK